MATKTPYSIKFNLRAFTEGADLDERVATMGRHAHTKTHESAHTPSSNMGPIWCESCFCQTCKGTRRLASHRHSVGINALHRPRYYLQG